MNPPNEEGWTLLKPLTWAEYEKQYLDSLRDESLAFVKEQRKKKEAAEKKRKPKK